MKKMNQSMWRSRARSLTKSTSRSLGAVRGVQWTFSIHSAYLLKSQSENKKLSWSVRMWFNEAFEGYTSLNHNDICHIPYENASRTRLRNLCIISTLYFNWMNNLQNYYSILWELKKMQKYIKRRENTVVYW